MCCGSVGAVCYAWGVSRATFNFSGLGSVQLSIEDVWLHQGVTSHRLVFRTMRHAEWLTPGDSNSYAPSLMTGSLWINAPGHQWVTTMEPVAELLWGNPVSIELCAELRDEQLVALEALRPGGDLDLTLKVDLTLLAPEDGVYPLQQVQIGYRLQSHQWQRLLQQLGKEVGMSVRVPTPLDDPTVLAAGGASLAAVAAHLRQAQAEFRNQQYKTCVGTCRHALEALGQLHEVPSANSLKTVELKSRDQSQRWAAVFHDLVNVTHPAHHHDGVSTEFSWTRQEAEAVLSATFSLVARYVTP